MRIKTIPIKKKLTLVTQRSSSAWGALAQEILGRERDTGCPGLARLALARVQLDLAPLPCDGGKKGYFDT